MGLDLSKVDLFNTMASIRARGGAIFYDRVPGGTSNATAAGTSAARVSISTTYAVPSAAVELIAISPGLATTADAAADVKFAYCDIQGTSYKRQPQQVIAPVGSVDLSVGASRFTPQEWFTVRSKVGSNDTYDFGVYSYVANAHNMNAWMDLMFATIPSGLPAIYSQCSSATQAFKAVGNTSTGSLTLSNASEMYEIASANSGEAAAVGNEVQIVSHNVQCSTMDPIQSFNYGAETPAQITATSGDTQVMQLSRYMPLGLRFKAGNPTLNFVSTNKTATTNNMNIAHMVRYAGLD